MSLIPAMGTGRPGSGGSKDLVLPPCAYTEQALRSEYSNSVPDTGPGVGDGREQVRPCPPTGSSLKSARQTWSHKQMKKSEHCREHSQSTWEGDSMDTVALRPSGQRRPRRGGDFEGNTYETVYSLGNVAQSLAFGWHLMASSCS